MMDRETERSRGFGFVTFEDHEVARSLLTEGKDDKEVLGSVFLEMRGKMVEIKSAEPKTAVVSTGRRAGRGNGNTGNINWVADQCVRPTPSIYPLAPTSTFHHHQLPRYGMSTYYFTYADGSFGRNFPPASAPASPYYYHPGYNYYPYTEMSYMQSPMAPFTDPVNFNSIY